MEYGTLLTILVSNDKEIEYYVNGENIIEVYKYKGSVNEVLEFSDWQWNLDEDLLYRIQRDGYTIKSISDLAIQEFLVELINNYKIQNKIARNYLLDAIEKSKGGSTSTLSS